MTKSHVGMGYSICPVCGTHHDKVVLLDTRLRNTLEREQATGWAMCPEHQKLKDDGYIALIECTNEPTGLNDAERTGNIAHIRSSVWPNIFNAPVPPKGICFVPPEVTTLLQKMQKASATE